MLKNPLYDLLRLYGFRPSALADAIGVDRGTVTKWALTRVPKSRLETVARLTGIKPAILRPDLFITPKGANHDPVPSARPPSPALPAAK